MHMPEGLRPAALALTTVAALGACSVDKGPPIPIETLHTKTQTIDADGAVPNNPPAGFNISSVGVFAWQAGVLHYQWGKDSAVKIDDTHVLTSGTVLVNSDNELRTDCMSTLVVGRSKPDAESRSTQVTRAVGRNTTDTNLGLLEIPAGGPFAEIPSVTVQEGPLTLQPDTVLTVVHYGVTTHGIQRGPDLTPRQKDNNTERDYSEPTVHTTRVLGTDSNGYIVAANLGADYSKGVPGLETGEESGGGAVVNSSGQLVGVLALGLTPKPVRDLEKTFNVELEGISNNQKVSVIAFQPVNRALVDDLKKSLTPVKKC